MRVRVECYDRSRPVITINRAHPYFTVESDDENDDPKDVDYTPEEDEEDEDEDVYDPDEEQISDSEEGSDFEEEDEPEEEEEEDDETLRQPKPYYGNGYTIVFDSVEDKKEYFKNLSRKE